MRPRNLQYVLLDNTQQQMAGATFGMSAQTIFTSDINATSRFDLYGEALDVRFGSLADKPSQAKIHFCPLLLQ